jgi:hypothetical protein
VCAPWLIAIVGILAAVTPDAAPANLRPGTAIAYRIEPRDAAQDPAARFSASQLATLEKLNRADVKRLRRLKMLVVPAEWYDDDLRYSPFPLAYAAAGATRKLVIVSLTMQAFAAYEDGRLVRWGPVSSGRRPGLTPSGLFRLNWRSRARHSTVNPDWYMEWYFNFDNGGGLALHAYALPGYPASHGCIRLLERDAMWLYEWGEPGTPLHIAGLYAFAAPPPWRSIEQLAEGVDLPATMAFD